MKINIHQCTGCGNCLAHCPQQILTLSEDFNQRGVRYLCMKEDKPCLECAKCALMCTAGAISSLENQKNGGYPVINQKEIPPHAGCYLGSLTKALADVIHRMKIENQVVIFKKKASDVNLHVESHDYTDENFYEEGLQYKRKHPDKIVIIISASSKIHTTALNSERYRTLENENITIINTLNYFEADEQFTQVTKGGSHILEELVTLNKASYIARGSVRTPLQMLNLEKYLETAIQYQMLGKTYSFVEMVFPCFYRLSNRPQSLMPYEKITKLNQWYDTCIANDYILKEFKK